MPLPTGLVRGNAPPDRQLGPSRSFCRLSEAGQEALPEGPAPHGGWGGGLHTVGEQERGGRGGSTLQRQVLARQGHGTAHCVCRGLESPLCRHVPVPRVGRRRAACVCVSPAAMTKGPESDLPETTRGSVGKHEGARLSVTSQGPAQGTALWATASQGSRLSSLSNPGPTWPLLTTWRSGRLGGGQGFPMAYGPLVLLGKWPPAGLLGATGG